MKKIISATAILMTTPAIANLDNFNQLREIEQTISSPRFLFEIGACPSVENCTQGNYVFSKRSNEGVYLYFYGITERKKIKLIINQAINTTFSKQEKINLQLKFYEKPHSHYANSLNLLFMKPLISIEVR